MKTLASLKTALATLALAAATLTAAAPVLAAPARGRQEAVAQKKGDKGDKGSYPMAAADFKKKVEQRTTKARARMEKHITDKKVPEDKAKEARAKFDAAVAKINQKVEEVCSDGTVTKDEAKAVHDLAKSLHPRGKHGKKDAKKALASRTTGESPPAAGSSPSRGIL
jgi:hypothetical protein